MPYLVEFTLEEGESIIVEMDAEQLAGFTPAAVQPGEVAAKAAQTFEQAIDRLVPAIKAIGDRMRQLAPEETTVELGVKLSAEAGVILSKAAGEANFKVSLKWKAGSQG